MQLGEQNYIFSPKLTFSSNQFEIAPKSGAYIYNLSGWGPFFWWRSISVTHKWHIKSKGKEHRNWEARRNLVITCFFMFFLDSQSPKLLGSFRSQQKQFPRFRVPMVRSWRSTIWAVVPSTFPSWKFRVASLGRVTIYNLHTTTP